MSVVCLRIDIFLLPRQLLLLVQSVAKESFYLNHPKKNQASVFEVLTVVTVTYLVLAFEEFGYYCPLLVPSFLRPGINALPDLATLIAFATACFASITIFLRASKSVCNLSLCVLASILILDSEVTTIV